jgi:GDP-mannose 6-dehydrogenase
MEICVIGLGRVGLVVSVCLANLGHVVHGVDIDLTRTRAIQGGIAPGKEPNVENILHVVLASGNFRATSELASAVSNCEMSLLCVDTPCDGARGPSLTGIKCACSRLGKALKKLSNHCVVIKSTVLPGTTEKVIIPLLERFSGKTEGIDFQVAVNPEFLREGTAVYDFLHPTRLIIGSRHTASVDKVSELYKGINTEAIITEIETAEIIKYVDNSFHGLKIAFANEIARICETADVDASEVMNIFLKDTRLNISTAYLKPGFAFGGSCIPKDLRALNFLAKRKGVKTPLLASISKSNESHITHALETILGTGKEKIGVYGVSFKEGTDDLRESALLRLASLLLKQGKSVRIYDENVNQKATSRTSEQYLRKLIPNPQQVMVSSPSDIVDFADVIVIGHCEDTYVKMAARDPAKIVVDLTGMLKGSGHANYRSLFSYVSSRERVDDKLEREQISRTCSNRNREIIESA